MNIYLWREVKFRIEGRVGNRIKIKNIKLFLNIKRFNLTYCDEHYTLNSLIA